MSSSATPDWVLYLVIGPFVLIAWVLAIGLLVVVVAVVKDFLQEGF